MQEVLNAKESELHRLSRDEITENVVVVKINRKYHPGMSAQELYEAARGIWKRTIRSVEKAEFCLVVYKSEVVEVFRIDQWYPAGSTEYKIRELTAGQCAGRIEFTGEIAEAEIRGRYVGKSVADLFKNGEANPVKTFFVGDTD